MHGSYHSVWKDSLPAITAKLLGNSLQEMKVKLLVNSHRAFDILT